MKIVFLAPANNYHTKKWCKWFIKRGHNVSVISLLPIDEEIAGLKVFYLDSGVSAQASDWNKLRYLTKIFEVSAIIKRLNPDIINVHYATSYGALASFAGVKRFILSIWGSDVYDFPQKSFLHRWLIRFIFFRARRIFSTSHSMAVEASKYTKKEIEITPFGVDMNLFSPILRRRNDDFFVIGTVKSLSPKYGIETLLRAAALVRAKRPDIPLKVRIAGSGSHEQEYHLLATELGLDNCLTWLGFITQSEAAKEWANFDCAIIPSESESESFGVAAVEAQSCACPVIISDIPGLMEATNPGKSSVIVPRGEAEKLAEMIINIYHSTDKREKMGINGRVFVRNNYEIDECFCKVERNFQSLIMDCSK